MTNVCHEYRQRKKTKKQDCSYKIRTGANRLLYSQHKRAIIILKEFYLQLRLQWLWTFLKKGTRSCSWEWSSQLKRRDEVGPWFAFTIFFPLTCTCLIFFLLPSFVVKLQKNILRAKKSSWSGFWSQGHSLCYIVEAWHSGWEAQGAITVIFYWIQLTDWDFQCLLSLRTGAEENSSQDL